MSNDLMALKYKIDESREDFEARYVEGFPHTEFGVTHLSVPCTCDGIDSPMHWAAIRNDLAAMEDHFRHETCLADLRGYDRNYHG